VPLGGFSTCGNLSTAYDISADGSQIVGLVWQGCSARGFRWTATGGMQQFQNLANGNNRASVMSADGSVIGGFAQGSFDRTPALWASDTTGAVWDINTLGEVQGLNNSGSISLGTRYFSGSTYSAFMNSAGTGLVNLGTLQPNWAASAYDISEDGQTIGGFDYSGVARRAWVWAPILRASNGLTCL
jgi:uncharacterized membrane protein